MVAKKPSTRGRKKAVEAEIVPEDEFIEDDDSIEEIDDDPIVEQEHVIKNRYVKRMPLSEVNAPEESEDSQVIEQKRIVKSERQLLKEKLAKASIGNDALVLRVDRMPNYQINGTSGFNAEKVWEFNKTDCQIEFITSDEYLTEIQKRCGKGDYWLTLRHKNTILRAWAEHIGGSAPVAPPVAAVDPVSGQTIIYQTAPNGQTEIKQIDPFKQMESTLDMMEKFNKVTGRFQPQAQRPEQLAPPKEPTVIESALRVLNASSDVQNEIGLGLRKMLLGDPPEPPSTWAIVAQETFRHVGPILPQLGLALTQWLASKAGGGNGSTPMGQTALPQSAPPQAGAEVGAAVQGMASLPQPGGEVAQRQPSPPQPPAYLIQFLQAIAGNLDPKLVAQMIQQARIENPSIIPQIEQLLDMRPHALLIHLSMMGPQAAQVCSLPTAAEYIAKVQEAVDALSQSQEGEQS